MAAIRDKIEKNVQPYLEPGEKVQSAFPATAGPSPYFLILTGYLLSFWMKWVVIVVTDRRILLLKTSMSGTTKPKELLATFPRETQLGPVSGTYAKVMLGGTPYRVHRRFHKDIRSADSVTPDTTPELAPA